MTETATTDRPFWREALAPYARPHLGRSLFDLATSVVPYLALTVLMYLTVERSYLLTLAIAVLAAGFLLRVYIVFHDCTHGSFLPSKRANALVGSVTGLLVFTPFASWRHSHAVHHATAGDLERRGTGDVPTMTAAEYRAASWKGKLGYRLFRNPLVMFGLGWLWAMIIGPRIVRKDQRPRIKRSIILTNIALAAAVIGMSLLVGWQQFLLVQAPTAMLAGSAGVWMFYVQHQFEDVYWESTDNWSYADAALRGSSYLRLPKVLQFFTGNIGLHHVHHLSARVPNYNLQAAHDANPIFHDVPTLTIADGVRTVRLKLWDEHAGRMIGWAEERRTRPAARPAAQPAPAAGSAS
jgi:omega-6 fatty acid desaturase (delta-12 desaturase)